MADVKTTEELAVKPGYKTTEFWVMGLTYAINVLNLSGAWNFVSNWHSGLIMTAVTFAYTIARGLAKAGVLKAP